MMSALSAPDDLRNVRAAESLILLAKNATELPDEYWERLQPLYTILIQRAGEERRADFEPETISAACRL
jgi:hypothetical protein